jgi:hypothetical protein
LHVDQQTIEDNLQELRDAHLVILRQPLDAGGLIFGELTAAGRIKAREPDYRFAATRSAGQPLFDQHGQQIGTVYNVAGNLFLGPPQNRQEPADLDIADAWFEPKSEVGAAIRIKVKNWNEHEEEVTVSAHLQSGETLLPRAASGLTTIPFVIKAERTKVFSVPLTIYRAQPHVAPVVTAVEVQDALERKKQVPKELIERLNAQIVEQWPFSETDE